LTGVIDEQVDFEIEAEKDDRGAKRSICRQRGHAKQARVDQKRRLNRAFRGKIPDDVHGLERAQFIAEKARIRRLRLGIEGLTRKQRRLRSQSSSATVRFNLHAAVLQFRRTGRLPAVSLDVVREADAHGVDGATLKRMIQKMLIRAGIEENPGPPMNPDDVVPTPKWRPRKDKEHESVNTPTQSSSSSREDEKRARCGGNEPGEKKRLDDKKSRGRKNFATASLLSAAGMLEADKKAGDKIAQADKSKVEAEETEWKIRASYVSNRPAFVMRSGGFARPWYVGFGRPQTKPQLLYSMLQYILVWWQYVRGMGDMPLWSPRDGVRWRPFGPEDQEYATPVFKGIAFSVLACVLAVLFGSIGAIFTWLYSFNSFIALFGWGLAWFTRSVAFIQFFGALFRPIFRYLPGDIMREFSVLSYHALDPYFDGQMRMTGMRYRPATDAAVLASVDVRTASVDDQTVWYQKYMATSWLFGSLFNWLEVNRLISIVLEPARWVISVRVADMIATGLARTRLDSYQDVESKARNLVSTYDELKLGTQVVDGRNVRDDTIRYAASLYWSKQASDASLGNGGSPHSD